MRLLRRLWFLLRQRRFEADLAEEMEFHREMAAEDGRPSAFGSVSLAKDHARDVWMSRWVQDAAQDLRFAWRTLRRSPSFTVVAMLTLAIGIGTNTAIFSALNAVVLESLPVREPDRLVLFSDAIGEGTHTGDDPIGRWEMFSYPVFEHLRDHAAPYFQGIAAFRSGETQVTVQVPGADVSGPLPRAQAHLVSGNYFNVMGADAVAGRVLTGADERSGAVPAIVVSDGFWKTRLNADPAAIGDVVVLNSTSFTIVGVMGPEFFGERVRRSPDIWVPLAFQPEIELKPSFLARTDAHWLSLVGRLASDATLRDAESASTTALRQFLRSAADDGPESDDQARRLGEARVELVPGGRGISVLRSFYARPLQILLAAVSLLLLMACANIATLLLARTAAREREFVMRVALGATAGRLMRQLLVESALLATAAAVCGTLGASWTAQLLITNLVSANAPLRAALNGYVLAFAIVIAAVTAVLFGLGATLHAGRTSLAASRGGGQGRFMGGLIAVQVAVSVVLLAGAGLMLRSLVNLEGAPLGFDHDQVLIARISPRLAGYDPANVVTLYEQLQDRARALPGVTAAALASYSPLSGSHSSHSLRVEGYDAAPNEEVSVQRIFVGPNYISVIGITLLQGRPVDARDRESTPPVVMVNEAFSRKFFPNSSPIGRRLSFDGSGRQFEYEIVGLVADAQFNDIRQSIEPTVFPALFQAPADSILAAEFAARTAGDPNALAQDLRTAFSQVAPSLPVATRTLASQVSSTLNTDRLAAQLVGMFALAALLLAAIGLYGVIAREVVRRTPEIGVRLAVGAPRLSIVLMMLQQIFVPVGGGLAVGLLAATAATRLIQSQLYGVSATDPASYATALAVLIMVAFAASLFPSYRASQIDPVLALHRE